MTADVAVMPSSPSPGAPLDSNGDPTAYDASDDSGFMLIFPTSIQPPEPPRRAPWLTGMAIVTSATS